MQRQLMWEDGCGVVTVFHAGVALHPLVSNTCGFQPLWTDHILLFLLDGNKLYSHINRQNETNILNPRSFRAV